MIPTKSKNQVVHEQNVRVERRVLDLESECMRGLGSIPDWGGGNIFHWIFFSHSEASDANIGIMANVVCL